MGLRRPRFCRPARTADVNDRADASGELLGAVVAAIAEPELRSLQATESNRSLSCTVGHSLQTIGSTIQCRLGVPAADRNHDQRRASRSRRNAAALAAVSRSGCAREEACSAARASAAVAAPHLRHREVQPRLVIARVDRRAPRGRARPRASRSPASTASTPRPLSGSGIARGERDRRPVGLAPPRARPAERAQRVARGSSRRRRCWGRARWRASNSASASAGAAARAPAATPRWLCGSGSDGIERDRAPLRAHRLLERRPAASSAIGALVPGHADPRARSSPGRAAPPPPRAARPARAQRGGQRPAEGGVARLLARRAPRSASAAARVSPRASAQIASSKRCQASSASLGSRQGRLGRRRRRRGHVAERAQPLRDLGVVGGRAARRAPCARSASRPRRRRSASGAARGDEVARLAADRRRGRRARGAARRCSLSAPSAQRAQRRPSRASAGYSVSA